MISNRVPLTVSRNRAGRTALTARAADTSAPITASFSGQSPLGNMGGGGGGYKDSYLMGGVDVATPYIENLPHRLLCQMYEDIYLHDSTCGTAVDILSNTPFSNFQLHIPAEKDRDKISEVFRESIHNLRFNTLLPIIARERMVYGAHISMLLYRQNTKSFTDLIPFNYKDCDIYSSPVYGREPVIKVNIPQMTKEYLGMKSESVEELKEAIGDEVTALLQANVLELEPTTTLHVSNKVLGWNDTGYSSYRRVLPLYILEKVLHRGTVTMANRRQTSILHVQAGADDWEPTSEELGDLIAGINKTLSDPIGAVIATNNRVNFNEVNPAGDLWRWNDIMEQLHGQKLIALGINETLLSGDACLTGDSLIPTNEGIIALEDLKPDDAVMVKNYPNPMQISVGSRYKNAKTRFWVYAGKKLTYKVDLENGESIRTSENHRLLTLNDVETDWVRTDKIAVGDWLCIPTKPILRKKPLPLGLSGHMEFPAKTSKGNYLKTPKNMSPELAYFLGALIAEGWVTNQRVWIANSDEDILKHLEKCAKKVFGVDLIRYKTSDKGTPYTIYGKDGVTNQDCWTVSIGSQQLCTWLEELGIDIDARSKDKVIPWSVLQADEESQLAFLAAYLDCDGSVRGDGRLCWISHSDQIIRSISAILRAHGILCNRDERVVGVQGYDGKLLWKKMGKYVQGDYPEYEELTFKARRTFGIPIGSMVEELEDRFIRFNNTGAYYLNDVGEEVRVIKARFPYDGNGSNEPLFLYDRYEAGYYDDFMAALAIISPSYHSKLLKLIKLRYSYVKVAQIAKHKVEKLYDLSMKGNEPAYTANGIVVHNTYSNLEQAIQIMMTTMDSMRNQIVNGALYNKLFPLISRIHGFTKDAYGTEKDDGIITAAAKEAKYESGLDHRAIAERSKLIIPAVKWEKQLIPHGGDPVIDMMDKLAQRGVPFSLRAYCMAAGYDLDDLMAQAELAKDDEKKLKAARKALGMPEEPLQGPGQPEYQWQQEQDNMQEQQEQAGMILASMNPRQRHALVSSLMGVLPDVGGPLNRKFTDAEYELKSYTKTGKRRWVPAQERRQKEMNERVVMAATKMEQENRNFTISYPAMPRTKKKDK